ncbi:MAG: hypothetical protein U9R43_17535 [Thermodesulfobacteriota bacterium]|nr:hypothetical protein [Thermodesulfobacteriota bacterium]
MIAKRIDKITSFIVMDVLEKAHEMEREGTHIIHLEVGDISKVALHTPPLYN